MPRESQARLRAVLDSLSEGVVLFTLDGHVLDMNPAAMRLTGLTSLEQAQRSLADFAALFELQTLDGRILDLQEWPLARVLRGESFVDYEVLVRRRDGSDTRFISYNGSRVHGAEHGTTLGVLTLRDISERKRHEIALHEGERRLFLALEASNARVWEMHEDSDMVYGTEALATTLGHDPEEMRTLGDWLDLVHDDERPLLLNDIQGVRQGKWKGYRCEWRIRSRSGRWHWFQSQAMAAEQSAGARLRGIIGTYINIDERKRAEKALAESERLLAIALEASAATVWVIDGDSRVLHGAQSLATFLGYSPDRLRTVPDWLALVHEGQRRELENLVEETLAGKRDEFRQEWQIRARDGRSHWFLCQAKARGEDGRQRGRQLIGTYINIDERKEAQHALQESERRLALALAAGGSAVWELEAASGAIRGSDNLYSMYGYAPDRLKTLADWQALIHPDDRPQAGRNIRDAIEGRADGCSFEVRLRHGDGSWHWNLSNALVTERDAEGGAVRIVGTHTDISDRKAAEEQIRRLNADLERRVSERTAELEHANEVLLHRNLELQNFAHAMAHDLKTPLRSIVGFTQLLQQAAVSCADPQIDAWAAHIVANTKRLHVLIEDILSYTRLDAQGLPFEMVDMERLAGEVIASLDTLISATGAEVRSAGLPGIVADRTQMAQLLQNLIENGLKYNISKPPRVSISARPGEREWLFAVADNGMGIAPEHQQEIFGMFKRLHTYAQIPGTGVGLALCRRIVERHGGRIWVESEPGRGSTFYFTLPVRAAEAA